MPDEPIFDFAVLSDDRQDSKNPNGWTEKVWRFENDWHPGELLGEVRIQEAGEKRFVARFTFTSKDLHPVTVTGGVPETDGRPWVGRGRANAARDGHEQEVDIEFRNPKKWG